MGKWSSWPNQCTAFCISIASSLWSLKHNSGQADSLCPISPSQLFFAYTRQTACSNNRHSTMHIPISTLSIQRLTYIYLKLKQHILWYTYTENQAAHMHQQMEHWAAYIQWAYWALNSTHAMSILSIEQHTYNAHIEHWAVYNEHIKHWSGGWGKAHSAVRIHWAYWTSSSTHTMSIWNIEQHTYNEHIEHWAAHVQYELIKHWAAHIQWAYWALGQHTCNEHIMDWAIHAGNMQQLMYRINL